LSVHVWVVFENPEGEGWTGVSWGTGVDHETDMPTLEVWRTTVPLERHVVFALRTTAQHMRERARQVREVIDFHSNDSAYSFTTHNCRMFTFELLVDGFGFEADDVRRYFHERGLYTGIPTAAEFEGIAETHYLRFKSFLRGLWHEPKHVLTYLCAQLGDPTFSNEYRNSEDKPFDSTTRPYYESSDKRRGRSEAARAAGVF
jgi:hypothetical protein